MSRQANTKLYTYMYQFKPSSRKLLNMLHYYKALHTITKRTCIYKYLVRSFLRLTKSDKHLSTNTNSKIQKLECNHVHDGPFRIRRHDALRDVVWHALLQDNTTVCREQRITGYCHDRPRDIYMYHPDFSNGKPSFFDISVQSSLQASFISQCSITTGVAGARGEMQKDEKHRQLVEENGGVFIPLVVEVMGYGPHLQRRH